MCFVIYFVLLEYCFHLFVEHQYKFLFFSLCGECLSEIAAWQRALGLI